MKYVQPTAVSTLQAYTARVMLLSCWRQVENRIRQCLL